MAEPEECKMTPQINVSQSLFDKLKELAEPFVDTPESVVTRCVDFYISKHGSVNEEPVKAQIGDAGAMVFAADAAPDLTFTRPLSIKLDGFPYQKIDLYWNALLFDVVAKAASMIKSKETLKKIMLVNYIDGESSEKGYRFIASAGLSVQGQDSNAAWKAAMHIIKAVHMNIDVLFMWENKDKAAHPGKTGRMTYKAP
jgi:hypothetical protein